MGDEGWTRGYDQLEWGQKVFVRWVGVAEARQAVPLREAMKELSMRLERADFMRKRKRMGVMETAMLKTPAEQAYEPSCQTLGGFTLAIASVARERGAPVRNRRATLPRDDPGLLRLQRLERFRPPGAERL